MSKPSAAAKAAFALAQLRAEVSEWTDEKLIANTPDATDRSKGAPIIRAEIARRGL